MTVYFDEVKEIVESLPIGFYAKRRIPMTTKKDIETSYYAINEDKIYISYDIIATGLENADEADTYKEVAIRSMVYHELSHAILTPVPDDTFNYIEKSGIDFNLLNIFEDERIETILKNFYLDVNFKKNILYVNGGTIKEPTTPQGAFYNLVRFRCYKNTSFAKEVENIIEKYKKLNCNSGIKDSWTCIGYCNDIQKLFDDFSNAYNNNQLPFTEEEKNNIMNTINGGINSNGFDTNNTEEKENCGNGGASSQTEQSINENGENENSNENSEADGQKGKEYGLGDSSIFTDVVNRYIDTTLTNTLETIIQQFNKKNNRGNGTTSYSGIFNPRNILHNDYKYFDRTSSAQGNNKFGTFHLNLFIDNSGSFSGNQDRANTLIKSLLEIEKRNKNFTFDVIKCDNALRETTKTDCFLTTDGGTYARPNEVKQSMQKHNKTNNCNYNIVMYDGYCGGRPFSAWDRKNVTIIDTGDNKRELYKLTNARVVYIPYGELVNRLTDEVIKAIQKAFR